MLLRFRPAGPGLLLLLTSVAQAQIAPVPPSPTPARLAPAHPATPPDDTTRVAPWTVHFQQTVITQWHADFRAPYSGEYSLQPREKAKTSLTSTVFLGRRLWRGASVYFNPELAGGSGLSQARGVAGFVNGETFRIGDPAPKLYVARAFFRQQWALGPGAEVSDDAPNQLGGPTPRRYFALSLGKFCLADFFDQNRYSHDPRSQFFNWSLMGNGAWDYPANTRGYTIGAVAELVTPGWAFRAASSLEPTTANGPDLETSLRRAHAETAELTRLYHLPGGRDGAVRLLGFVNHAPMGDYWQAAGRPDLDLAATRQVGRTKYGWGLSAGQQLGDWWGVFGRAGWNDGRHETWAFTEIDRTLSLGLSGDGRRWQRPADGFGLAAVANGLSQPHRDFLAAGGHGFMLGDGQLRYGPEMIAEAYYAFSIPALHASLTPDYQLVLHPGYNRDRGPVNVVAARLHVAI